MLRGDSEARRLPRVDDADLRVGEGGVALDAVHQRYAAPAGRKNALERDDLWPLAA